MHNLNEIFTHTHTSSTFLFFLRKQYRKKYLYSTSYTFLFQLGGFPPT